MIYVAIGYAFGFILGWWFSWSTHKTTKKLKAEYIFNYQDLSFFGAETLTEAHGVQIKVLAVGVEGVTIHAWKSPQHNTYWDTDGSGEALKSKVYESKLDWLSVRKHFPQYAEEINMFLAAQVKA